MISLSIFKICKYISIDTQINQYNFQVNNPNGKTKIFEILSSFKSKEFDEQSRIISLIRNRCGLLDRYEKLFDNEGID